MKRARCVQASPVDSIKEVGDRRMLAKLIPIMGNTSHPCMRLEALSSSFSNKLLQPPCRMALKYTCMSVYTTLTVYFSIISLIHFFLPAAVISEGFV